MTPVPTPTNADLYRAGRQYAARRTRRAATGEAATWRAVAAEREVARGDVVRAARFADAVDRIAAACGRGAKNLLLSDHPQLPARVVVEVGHTHADRQRYALARARAGRAPLGKPPAGTDPPFDTHGYPEVISRLARNAGLIDYVAEGLRVTPRENWPGGERLNRILEESRRVITACRSVAARVAAAGGRPKDGRPRVPWAARASASPSAAASAVRHVASVRGVAEKNARELPRLIRETPPTRAQADAVYERTRVLEESARRLRAVIRARDHDVRTGPSDVFGTYVTFFHLPSPVMRLRIGALGTFDFPAGYYAYLGSAFGCGGVRARTGRHLTVATPKLWNIDWLKPLCAPVAVWWTHERRRVEFDWAGVLAAMPGATFPAPRFGAADNTAAEAHLARFGAMPSVAEFRRRVDAAMPGHAPVYEKAVENWTGRGWPR